MANTSATHFVVLRRPKSVYERLPQTHSTHLKPPDVADIDVRYVRQQMLCHCYAQGASVTSNPFSPYSASGCSRNQCFQYVRELILWFCCPRRAIMKGSLQPIQPTLSFRMWWTSISNTSVNQCCGLCAQKPFMEGSFKSTQSILSLRVWWASLPNTSVNPFCGPKSFNERTNWAKLVTHSTYLCVRDRLGPPIFSLRKWQTCAIRPQTHFLALL